MEMNPIMEFFDIGKESSTAGPSLVWRVHDAFRKSDGKECSVFVFDKRIAEKIFKPKRKDCIVDKLKMCIAHLERMRHPKMLQVIHSLEEGLNTIAFAAEPIIGSLHNILAWHESSELPLGAPPSVEPNPVLVGTSSSNQSPPESPPPERPPFAREYYFLDIELRYGLLQIIEALHYLHYTTRQIHRNVCPMVIIITKRGTWKLFGLEFVEDIIGADPTDIVHVAPWSIKVARIAQPSLDFLAPEVQTTGQCNILSDMFSLGLVICAVFNNGKQLIQANNNPVLYLRQIEHLDRQVSAVLPRVPAALREAVQRLTSRDPHPRPTTLLLPLIKYFKCSAEPIIHALQFLDVISMKDVAQKCNFYQVILIDVLPFIPKKLRWQHVWPALQLEVRVAEILAAALHPVLWLTNDSSPDEFTQFVLPTWKSLMSTPKSVQASITILESMHAILKKCDKVETEREIMPLLYKALDSTNNQIQTSSLIAIHTVSDHIDNQSLHTIVLGKVKIVIENNRSDVKVVSLTLGFYEKILGRLERSDVLEHMIPTLLLMKITDPDIVSRVVKLYKAMLMEKKFGLNSNVMATKMIPSLAPQTVNPGMNPEQFTNIMQILYDMLDNIDKTQRHRFGAIKASPDRNRLRQMSTDNVAPPFNIPNLRVEQRKTSSAEDMVRKNSVAAAAPPPTGSVGGGFKSTGIGQWFFGSNNSNSNDGNFLRVASAFPNRRLSDNTLMTPKIRIAPSCASSPGGTPGGSTAGLPTRRHSSIGPQERRGSTVNLSPPTGHRQYRGRAGGSGSSLSVPSGSQRAGGSMPNTSSSVPFLLTSSMHSVRSRRPSACSSQGSGLLHQISSGMYQLFSGHP